MLTEEISHFFQKQGFVVVTTIDSDGFPHCSCKGIVTISDSGDLYLLDLYTGSTYKNLQVNSNIAITGVDEHKFSGYCLKGKASILKENEITPELQEVWKKRIASRVTTRVLKQIKGEKGHPSHPEIMFPSPKYIISMKVLEVVNLAPR